MLAALDIKTVFIYTGLVNLCVVSIAVIAWLRNPTQKALIIWALAALCTALSGLLISKVGVMSVERLELVGGTLLITMTGFLWLGFKEFFRAEYRVIDAFMVAAVAAILMVIAELLPDPVNARGFIMHMGAAVNLFSAAHVVATQPTREWLPSRDLAVVLLYGYASATLLIAPLPLVMPVQVINGAPVSEWLGGASVLLAIFNMATFLVAVVLKLERASDGQRRLAERDALTGVLNRRMFFSLGEKFARSSSGAIAMIDIDHFKKINDTYGHKGGDNALVEVTRTIETHLSSGVLFARLGGEEFALWLPDGDRSAVASLLERLRVAVERLDIECGESRFRLTISCGYVMISESASKTLDAWVNDADSALYLAKNGGRNRVMQHQAPS